jgi:hypothetical protein
MSADDIKTQIEVQAKALPSASIETLKRMRQEQCSSSGGFHLASFQLFLRRIMSPDSPTRNMLLVHGTGTGKTCSAIQIAEEYILRPEFQDKKVLVLASEAIRDNFRTQLFDVERVQKDGDVLKSPQCTGRRYLEMLERAQSEGLRWENPESREKLGQIVNKMISEFYDFTGYMQFANTVDKKFLTLSKNDFAEWVRTNFNGKLLIVDEAHNLRESDAEKPSEHKLVSDSIQRVVKAAEGMTLVLLTATPMYDSFQEILFLFNLFLWNDKRQASDQKRIASDFFQSSGEFASPDAEARFRGLCHEYVSFIRGENPFTFPFRLPPPDAMVAKFDRKTDYRGMKIRIPRKYLSLVVSYVDSPQKEQVSVRTGEGNALMIPTIVASPDGRSVAKCFLTATDTSKSQLRYAPDVIPFLSPSNVSRHASKFSTVLRCIQESTGIVFVYSNFVRGGVLQFAMTLEEHGYKPAAGLPVLENPSGEFKGQSPGKYAFLTSDMTSSQIRNLIRTIRSPENMNGSLIRVVVASPLVSEGVDLQNVRQVHVLDPWYNMSRIEQIIGRGLRNCSHAGLPFEDQNCTIYLHVVRYADSAQETYDETAYRVFVEAKAKRIAAVRRILQESSIDCTSQIATNQLPDDWRSLVIEQRRAQGRELISMPLSTMSAPTFEDGAAAVVCSVHERTNSPDYVRPLSSYYDIRDEVFDKLMVMFETKPVWSRDDLLKQLHFAPDVVSYIVDNAIHTHLKMKDSAGRTGTLENRKGLYAFSPNGLGSGTMVERSMRDDAPLRASVDIPEEETKKAEKEEKVEKEEKEEKETETKEEEEEMAPTAFTFPFDTRLFSKEILDAYVREQVAEESPHDDPRLVIPGLNYVVHGADKIYNPAEKKYVTPVGGEADALDTWARQVVDHLAHEIRDNNKIMVTVSEKKTLKIAAFEADGTDNIRRVVRDKTVAPVECTSATGPMMNAFVKAVSGHEFPPDVKTKDTKCPYMSLVARMPSDKLVWVLPEVWSFIGGTKKYSNMLRAKIVKTDPTSK